METTNTSIYRLSNTTKKKPFHIGDLAYYHIKNEKYNGIIYGMIIEVNPNTCRMVILERKDLSDYQHHNIGQILFYQNDFLTLISSNMKLQYTSVFAPNCLKEESSFETGNLVCIDTVKGYKVRGMIIKTGFNTCDIVVLDVEDNSSDFQFYTIGSVHNFEKKSLTLINGTLALTQEF